MFDSFDDLNPAFRDEEAFIDTDGLYDEYGVFVLEIGEVDEDDLDDPLDDIEDLDEDDDFDEMLEYDDWQEDMYADGDGFYTNDPGDEY